MVPLQVLVAGDEPVSRTVVGAMPKKAGYAVIFAQDGDEAWACLNSNDPPALALLDWEMPGISGPKVVQRLRTRPDVPTPADVILAPPLVDALGVEYGKVEAEIHRLFGK